MQNVSGLGYRAILAGAIAGLFAIGGAACSSSSTGGSPPNQSDGAASDSSTGVDGGDAAAPLANPQIIVLNATENNTPPLRVCFSLNSALGFLPGIPPLPYNNQLPVPGQTYPGIPSGFAGPLPNVIYNLNSTAIVVAAALPTQTVYPYILNAANPYVASSVQSNKGKAGYYDCFTLIQSIGDAGTPNDAGPGLLTPNVDYWQLPSIPSGTFALGNSYVVVVTGCASASNASLCGPPVAGSTSNFNISIVQLDNSVPATTTAIYGQAFQASSALKNGAFDGGAGQNGVTVSIVSPDGGPSYVIAPDAGFPGSLTSAGIQKPVPFPSTAIADIGQLISGNYEVLVTAGTTPITAVPLTSVMALSAMTDAGGNQFLPFTDGTPYTFMVTHGSVAPGQPASFITIALPNTSPVPAPTYFP